MKKLILLTSAICLLISMNSFAQEQEEKKGYFKTSYYDLGSSFGSGQFAGSLSWSHLHGLGSKKQKLKIGYGLRFLSYFGSDQNYTTAPAKYTSNEADIDTLKFASSQINSLNVSLHIQYSIVKKVEVGFNIDAVGFSFGGSQKAGLVSSVRGTIAPIQSAKPTSLNLLLVGDNDIGSLSSEFYVRYWITERFGIRGGLNYLFTEYTTDNALKLDNGRIEVDRFRNKSMMGFLALTFKPF